MPRITRWGHDRSSNLRAAPEWLTPEKVGRLIRFMDGLEAPAIGRLTPGAPASAEEVVRLQRAVAKASRRPVPAHKVQKIEFLPPSDTKPVQMGDAKGVSPVRSDSRCDPEAGRAEPGRRPSGQSRAKPSGTAPRKADETAPAAVIAPPVAVTPSEIPDVPAAQPVANNKNDGAEPHFAALGRMDMIRAAAERLAARQPAAPKPAYAPSTKAEISISARPDWIAQRAERLNGAIAFLKARCILVTPVDRQALVGTYYMTGNQNRFTAEQVIARAVRLGWESAE